MRTLIEKHFFLLVGLSILAICDNSINNIVIIFLMGVIFTEASIIFTDKRLLIFAGIIYLICSFFFWPLIFFLPVIIYSLVQYSFYYGFVSLALLIKLVYETDNLWSIIGLLILCVFAVLLSYENRLADKYKKKYIEMVDSSTELEAKLKKKNKALLENQDANIHIATLQERNRIAREIHDNVGHMLSRTILQLGALMVINKEEPLNSQLKSINDTLNEAMNNIRESVHDLHNESLDLELAVEEATKDLREKYIIKVDFDMSQDVPRNIKYCFIAIVKEALANVVKHSDASKIDILLREHPGFYQLIVEDNGSASGDKHEAGMGLSNMEDRVSGLLGNIRFSDSNGFRINITIPKQEQ